MAWSCGECRADVDDELDLCWQCGTGRDGSPPPGDWRSELSAPVPVGERSMNCLHCADSMAYAGRKRFHDSSYLTEALLGEFFVNREALDLYVCRGCGKVELFAMRPAP